LFGYDGDRGQAFQVTATMHQRGPNGLQPTQRLRACWLSLLLLLLPFHRAEGQLLEYLWPPGGQRDSTVEVTFRGQGLTGVRSLWAEVDLQGTLIASATQGGGRATLRVFLPLECPIGPVALRLVTSEGVSNVKRFFIDDRPPLAEKEPNNRPELAQPIPVETSLYGFADQENWDYFKVHGEKGSRLTVDLYAQRLGSPLDAHLRLLDRTGQREMAFADDSDGVGRDPRLTFCFPETGEYLLEVRDVQYRGGESFIYWMRVGNFPAVALPLPLAAKRGAVSRIQFPGADPLEAEVCVPSDPTLTGIMLQARWEGWTLPVSLAVDELEEKVEVEPNDSSPRSTLLQPPAALNGLFDRPGDVDRVAFEAKGGQKWRFEVTSREMGSPADVVLSIRDEQGRELASADDAGNQDASLDLTVPNDGRYEVVLRELTGQGGPAFVYRLRVVPAGPDFRLTLRSPLDRSVVDRLAVPRHGNLPLLATVERRNYDGPIHITMDSLPEGVSCSMSVIPSGRSETLLMLSAGADARESCSRVLVKGCSEGNSVVRLADTAERIASDLNLLFAPVTLKSHFFVAVRPEHPFRLVAPAERLVVPRGASANLPVRVERREGFRAEVELSAIGLPNGITVQPARIDAEAAEAVLVVSSSQEAQPGSYPIAIAGSTKSPAGLSTAFSPIVTLEVHQAESQSPRGR
jgi:hypothetical protein